MTRKLPYFSTLLLLCTSATVPLHAQSRPPITMKGSGMPLREARSVIYEEDSFPRAAAKLVGEPAVRKVDGGFRIRFALDAPDDVLVRVVDGEGNVVRILGCGVLGPNAPEPFRKDSLEQELEWDGLDADGKAAPAGCRIEVAVGLRPRFERFVAHEPGQLLNRIIDLDVDPAGRLYVQLETGDMADPSIVRFDRDGKYLDMVYPSDPAKLAESRRRIEDVWPYTSQVGGVSIPHKPRAWTLHLGYRPYVPGIGLPFEITKDGTGWFAEPTTGWRSFGSKGEPFRMKKIEDLDRFWFLESYGLHKTDGPFVLDGRGFAYLCTQPVKTLAHTWSESREGVNDEHALGTIRKVDLATGQFAADFTWNGTEKLDSPRHYLGTPQIASLNVKDPETGQWEINKFKPDDFDGPNKFYDFAALAVDGEGRLWVGSDSMRRIKCYAADGRYLGQVESLDLDGRRTPLKGIRHLRWAGDALYLLMEERVVKCRVADALLTPVWSRPVDRMATALAIDTRDERPVVWIGGGHGPGTITRMIDGGETVGEVRQIGDQKGNRLAYPWVFAVDGKGRVFAYDHERGQIVRTDADGGSWKAAKVATDPTSMEVDRHGGRLLVSFGLGNNNTDWGKWPGFRCLDLETLEDTGFRLAPAYTDEELRERHKGKTDQYYPWTKTTGGRFAAVDRDGSILLLDGRRGIGWHKYGSSPGKPAEEWPGVIRRYARDGSIENEAVCRLFHPGGSAARDSRGNLYVTDLCEGGFVPLVHGPSFFTYRKRAPKFDPQPKLDPLNLRRGNAVIQSQSEMGFLLKFPPAGGDRLSENELWAHAGISPHAGGGCSCNWPADTLAIDGADRIFVADDDRKRVKILDTAGNMIASIGCFGNAQTVPTDGDAAKLGFRLIYCLDAVGDTAFVGDKDLRRIAKLRMTYRETREAKLP